MSLDIKVNVIKPKRQTYGNIAERFGEDKPASRYEEATLDLEPTENFHYRPTWDPSFELYDHSRTKIKMEDWYALKDPRQFYYATYTINRNKMFEGAESQLTFVENRNLMALVDAESRDLIKKVLLPLRHYEWGANMNNMEITRFGSGTSVTQACAFDAMDRLGLAQLLCRIGLIFDASMNVSEEADKSENSEDGVAGSCLHVTRVEWVGDDLWQPLRKAVENSLVLKDWYELFIAQNFVMDTLVYEFAHNHFDQMMAERGVQSASLITEIFRSWFNDRDRWVMAVLKRTISESDENKQQISDWVNDWAEQVQPAIAALADYAMPEKSGEVVSACMDELERKKSAIGL